MLTQARLKEVLHYDPDTGVFTWVGSSRRGWNGRVAGCVMGKGYVYIGVDHKLYLAHRLAWLYVRGVFPPDQIDHHDQNKTNNMISNLRLATNMQNHMNKGRSIKNTSGYVGVHWAPGSRRWAACITANKKRHYLGLFESKEEAYMAYALAAERLHKEFARVR